MTRLRLLLRNLAWFKGVNIATALGVAVATAVLAGALMVGDSVRQSLAELTLIRLGDVDDALFAPQFFDASLTERLHVNGKITPAAIVQGAAADDATGNRTADVQIAALGNDDIASGQCIINGELADALGVSRPGDSIVLSVPIDGDTPREAALQRRARDDTISALRVQVSRIVREPGFLSLFNPKGGQRVPRNAWVNLADLQDAMDQPQRINALLVHETAPIGPAALNDALVHAVTLADFGLTQRTVLNGTMVAIGSRTTYLAPPVVAAAEAAAKKVGIPLQKISVNLLTTVRRESTPSPSQGEGSGEGGAAVQPSGETTQSGLQAVYPHPIPLPAREREPEAAGALTPSPGTPGEGRGEGSREAATRSTSLPPPQPSPGVPGEGEKPRSPAEAHVIHYAVGAGITPLDDTSLGPDDIAVNQWTADQLGLKIGDAISIDYPVVASTGELQTASAVFHLVRILPMTGIGVDPTLPPDYKGLTDADSVSDWNPPEGLKIDKSLVTKADEAYWHKYRAAPKVFISFDAAGRLWGGAFGAVTGLRVPAEKANEFLAALRDALPPASMAMVFRPIKAEQLAAAGGGTDFGQYFLYFSFFLIVAAVLLTAMLFRLGVEQRARQVGLLAAIGFKPGAIRRLAIGEGMILAIVGGAIGLAGGVGYTALIMAGLRTWWIGAVGTTAMHLHVQTQTLFVGYFSGVILALGAIIWGAWRIGRSPPATLLAGLWGSEIDRTAPSGKWLRIFGIAGAAVAIGTLMAAMSHSLAADVAFLCGGGLLLCSSLLWLAGTLRPRDRRRPGFIGTGALLRLGARNAQRHTARSVLAIGLVAFAVFTLVVVAVMRQEATPANESRSSGTGGYQLMLEAQIPILSDLNTVEGRKLAGIGNTDDPAWKDVHFTPMRRWAGQDISCLNLTRPTAPTILSVPQEMVDRHAFVAAQKLSPADNIWTLLASDQGGAIPVIADDETAQYILNLPLGGEMTVSDGLGQPQRLKLVGTLGNSVFQSALLMGEQNFHRLFPVQSGAGVMMIDCPPADAAALARSLSTELDEYSTSVETTQARLAMYQAVANTYLATFQTLGSLGLLLGTLGLGVVLVRTVIERRGELALLACLGFKSRDRIELVLAENLYLLLLGLVVGALCATIGVLPAVASSQRQMNFAGLLVTFAAVILVGLVSSAVAVAIGGAHASAADLRRE